jgi:predicted Zn-dependent protease with MMP-like domain
MKRDKFRRLVAEALDSIPARFRKKMANIAVVVEDWPPEEVLEEMEIEDPYELLGLYQGVPLDQREAAYGGALPDHIAIYQGPIESISDDPAELRRIVRDTVIHEVGHYFGLSDEEIERLTSG